MGRLQWGLVGAVIVVIVVVVLTMQGVFTDGGAPDQTVRPDETAAGDAVDDKAADAPVRKQESGGSADEAADAPVQEQESGGTAVAGGGESTGGRSASDEDDISDSPAAVDKSDEGDVSDLSGTIEDSDKSAEPEPSGTGDESDDALQAEAESFVRQLAAPSDEPLQVESAEGFVGADRPLASAGGDSESADATPPDAAQAEDAVSPGPGGEAEADVEVVAQSGVAEAGTADDPGVDNDEDGGEAAAPSATDAAKPGETPAAAAGETGSVDVHAARVDLPLSEEAPVTIAELLGAEEVIPSDAVFYVHTVRPEDDRGIWGIVHDGIVENFAEGVAVHRGETTETYRVDIPPGADQRRPDSSSSFLGRIIYEKSQKTYVYNYRTDRLGRNPDLIFPGQEIVIVSFTPEELVEIYKYFVGES